MKCVIVFDKKINPETLGTHIKLKTPVVLWIKQYIQQKCQITFFCTKLRKPMYF